MRTDGVADLLAYRAVAGARAGSELPQKRLDFRDTGDLGRLAASCWARRGQAGASEILPLKVRASRWQAWEWAASPDYSLRA
ncbi:MAG: hypothetical protein VW931_01925, partial [Alphaproteobacteria bacterium]